MVDEDGKVGGQVGGGGEEGQEALLLAAHHLLMGRRRQRGWEHDEQADELELDGR